MKQTRYIGYLSSKPLRIFENRSAGQTVLDIGQILFRWTSIMVLLEKDPFLKFSIFPNSDNLYLLHLHEIIGSFVFYQVVNAYIAPWLNKAIFKSHYTSIDDEKVRVNFDIHTVSNIQCLISFYTIAPILLLPVGLDIVMYHDELCSMVSALTMGYFLWDCYICVKHFKLYGFEFLAHALSSLYVFTVSLRPFCQPWVGKFLLFEASTPFVNTNFFIAQMSRGSTDAVVPPWFNMLNGLLLLVTFFSVRILWGFTAVTLLMRQMWKSRHQLPLVQSMILLVLKVGLNTLNIVWFKKMLKLAKKMMGGSSKVSKMA